ncbi:hypothetical protein C2845_PM03G25040 [Panicum miliaceum]|uniref:Uncharacterized protein n=1 Tax=Panicum miliaceum TaxID=4540 RepID=A0A3L6TBT8_PANMI|nr:hypothetical protein C2845_PM03G25040 [Panicum miliaceum]
MVAKVVDRLSYVVDAWMIRWARGRRRFIGIRGTLGRLSTIARGGQGASLSWRRGGGIVQRAWLQGAVRRVVREGCWYEVSVDGEEAEQLLTKAVYQSRPLYMWNGKHWMNSEKERRGLTAPSKCSHVIVVVSQAKAWWQRGGVPCYNVTITNTCLSCTVRNLHIFCGEFGSTRLVDPAAYDASEPPCRVRAKHWKPARLQE